MISSCFMLFIVIFEMYLFYISVFLPLDFMWMNRTLTWSCSNHNSTSVSCLISHDSRWLKGENWSSCGLQLVVLDKEEDYFSTRWSNVGEHVSATDQLIHFLSTPQPSHVIMRSGSGPKDTSGWNEPLLMTELSLGEQSRSSIIWEKLGGVLLNERDHLRRFRHLIKMPTTCLPLEVCLALGIDLISDPEVSGGIFNTLWSGRILDSFRRSWIESLGRERGLGFSPGHVKLYDMTTSGRRLFDG